MNWRIVFSALAISSTVWSGCNKEKELLDVEFDADFTVDLPVTQSSKSVDVTFLVEESVDPLADETVEQFKNNIKSWNITDLTGVFLTSNPDFDLSTTKISITSGDKSAVWNLADQAITEGLQIILGNEDGQWDTVDEILGLKQVFTVRFSGDSSQNVDFTLRLNIFTKVTANPQ